MMMLAAFKEIINPDVIIDIATSDKLLILIENSPESKIRELHIQGVPENSFAFALEYRPPGKPQKWLKQLSYYVKSDNDIGVNKGCDLILLVPQKNDHWVVLICELKSDKPKKGDTEKQLLNSELYIRYLMSMVNSYYQPKFNNAKIITRTMRFF